MGEPDIVILDEPTNALIEGIGMVKTILAQQKERGALVIISCHDLNLLKGNDEVFLFRGWEDSKYGILNYSYGWRELL